MPTFDDVHALAQVMPGRWTVKATNLPAWLTGERRDALLEFFGTRDRDGSRLGIVHRCAQRITPTCRRIPRTAHPIAVRHGLG